MRTTILSALFMVTVVQGASAYKTEVAAIPELVGVHQPVETAIVSTFVLNDLEEHVTGAVLRIVGKEEKGEALCGEYYHTKAFTFRLRVWPRSRPCAPFLNSASGGFAGFGPDEEIDYDKPLHYVCKTWWFTPSETVDVFIDLRPILREECVEIEPLGTLTVTEATIEFFSEPRSTETPVEETTWGAVKSIYK